MALQSVNLNGSSQYATCGNVPTAGISALTVEGWFRLTSTASATMGLLAKDGAGGQDWALATASNTQIMFRVKNNLGSTQTAFYTAAGITAGVWYHVAGVWNGATVKVYVNGVAGATAPALTGTVSSSSQVVEIGRYSTTGYLNGRVGWGRVSSSARYTANFVPPSLPPKVDAATLAQWNCVEGSGTSLDNIQGTATYDGVLTGSPSWLSDTPWQHTAIDSAHTFELLIDGVDYWANVRRGSFRFKEGEGSQVSNLDVELEEVGTGLSIVGWKEVVWRVDGERAFGGYVVKAKPTLNKADRLVWAVAAEGYPTEFAKASRIRKTYTRQTPKAILQNLFTTAGLSGYDTTTHVTTGTTIDSFPVNGEKFAEILDRLALVAGIGLWTWRVDANKAVWFGPATSDLARFSLAALASANYTSSFPPLKAPTKDVDETDIRNRITVTGGVAPSAPLSDSFNGDASTLIFTLTHRPVVDVLMVKVGGVLQRHGVDWYHTFAQGYDCLINYVTGTVRWDTGHAPPAGTGNVEVRYRYGSLVQVQRTDAASYAHYGRYFDYELNDGGITTAAEATAIADALLALYAMPNVYGEVVVERWGIMAGQRMRIEFPLLGLTGYYVIQAMTTELLNDGEMVRCTLKYGGKLPKAREIAAATGTGGGNLTGDPVGVGWPQIGGGGPVLGGSPQLNAEIDITRVNDRIEVIDRATNYEDLGGGDYDTATGVVMTYDPTLRHGKLLGLNNGVVQAYFDSDGSIKAGGDAVIIDENGISLVEQGGAFPTPSRVRWFDASDHLRLDVGVSSGGTAAQLYGAEVPLTIGTYGAPNLPVEIATEYGAPILLHSSVQVGTGTTPDAKLDVAGNAVIDTGLVVNETGVDADTRIEGDTDANLVFVDASTDQVGIGTNAPASKLQVIGETRLGGASDYVKIASAGHLTMHGDATQWGSVRISPFAMLASTDAPAAHAFPRATSNTLVLYYFAQDYMNQLFFVAELPRSYKENAEILPRVHWVPETTPDPDVYCVWGIEYTIANQGDTFPATSTVTARYHKPAETQVPDRHYVTPFDPIAGSGEKMGVVIVGRLFRDGADDNDRMKGDAGLLMLEFIFEMDSIGSESATSKA